MLALGGELATGGEPHRELVGCRDFAMGRRVERAVNDPERAGEREPRTHSLGIGNLRERDQRAI